MSLKYEDRNFYICLTCMGFICACNLWWPAALPKAKGTAIGAGIFKQSMRARNRVGLGRLYRLAELIPWN